VTNLTLPSRAVVRFYNLTGQNEREVCSPMARSSPLDFLLFFLY
jgi:hypothetical protein